MGQTGKKQSGNIGRVLCPVTEHQGKWRIPRRISRFAMDADSAQKAKKYARILLCWLTRLLGLVCMAHREEANFLSSKN